MRILRSLKLMLIPSLIVSCAIKSPDLVPCMCDGSEQTLGLLNCMCEPGKKKPVKRVSYIQDDNMRDQLKPSEDQANAYALLHKSRSSYAPVQLEYVDFRIPRGKMYDEFDTKLGNYRFRIFGCRRFDKEVFLNQGRAMQKDMKFFETFYETMNDYYPVVVDKSNPYYTYSDKAQPEYILTAEINDYFMNVCDEFDWDNVKKKNLRNGTSEMTVTWRLMDLTKSKVYCKGTTTGYGEMKNSEFKGETLLVERAFGDALSKLPEVECYNTEIAKRVKPEVLQAQLTELAVLERSKVNFRNQYDQELKGISMLQSCGSGDLNQSGGSNAQFTALPGNTPGSISSTGATDGKGRFVDANGNIIDEGGNIIAINRNGTLVGANGNLIDANGNIIDESGNIIFVNRNGALIANQDLVTENSGFDAAYNTTEERGGATAKFNSAKNKNLKGLMMNDNCSEITVGDDSCTTIKVSKNNITYTDDFWIDIPADSTSSLETKQNHAMAENMYAEGKSDFCIQSVKAYDKMSPENVYRLRASVVSVESPSGRKGAGLIVSDQLILTSADLIDKNKNSFDIKTINGINFKGSAMRVNPNKNVALILLDQKTKFAPLPLRLDLPEVGKDLYMTLGLLDLEDGENYLDNEGQVIGYRYSEQKGAEIIVNTYVQTQTLGSALIDKNGNITGLSHSGIRAEEGGDLFIPIETALKSLGMNICGVKFTEKMPSAVKAIEKPISTAIDNDKTSKAPKVMGSKERK